MTDLSAAIAALRAERDANASIGHEPVSWFLVDAALAALDAAQPVAWQVTRLGFPYRYVVRADVADEICCELRKDNPADSIEARPLYLAPQPPPAAVRAWILRTGHGTGIHIGERPPVDCVGWKPLTAGDIKDAPPAAVPDPHLYPEGMAVRGYANLAPREAPPAAVAVPSVEAAQRMGEQGGPAVESERLAFEAWMRGHCWVLGAIWNGNGYLGMNEEGGHVCPQATRTRGLWAAWRDRAALAAPPAAVPAANVTPMRQPRADLARLVESINAAVYANGDGLSVTEAIGALELAKLELLKEQEQ